VLPYEPIIYNVSEIYTIGISIRYHVSEFVSDDRCNALLVGGGCRARVVEQRGFSVEDQAPVLHRPRREVRHSRMDYTCTTGG